MKVFNGSPKIGQNNEDREAQTKLRFGCVCSSSSDIRRSLSCVICRIFLNFAEVNRCPPGVVDANVREANIGSEKKRISLAHTHT
jgi:hypothetical protein